MVLNVRHKCPRCRQPGDFQLLGFFNYGDLSEREKARALEVMPEFAEKPGDRNFLQMLSCACSLACCANCSQKILLVMGMTRASLAVNHAIALGKGDLPFKNLPQSEGKVLFSYPEPEKIEGHPSWPQKVTTSYISARRAHLDTEHSDPANVLGLVRTCFEVAMADKGARAPLGFKARIQKLQDDGILTKSAADWGRSIYDFGNMGAHEAEGTEAEAEEALAFLQLFMRISFEIPHEINAREKAKKAAQLPPGNGAT